MVHPGCRNRCIMELKVHVDFSTTYAKDFPNIWKRCRTCGYSIQTANIRCYCCHNPYSTQTIWFIQKTHIRNNIKDPGKEPHLK